jgi:tRNA pseudouridine13 synthase
VRPAHSDERAVGIGYYVSDADGTGGRLRDRPEDFRVRELESFETVPADAAPGSYPDLVLRATLRDRDTNGFAGDLADRLGISRERITWAGTKDKRAVTTQLFAVRGWEESPTAPEVPGADVEVVGRSGRPVLFGDLRGNAFEIVVREPDRPGAAAPVTGTLAAVAEGAAPGDGEVVDAGRDGTGDRIGGAPDADLPLSATVGVPNVFGMQRFGSLRPVTHLVGLAVVRGDWEDAVVTYLGETADTEPGETRAAREYVVETRDWQGGLERFPDRLGYERSLLHRLVERTGPDGGATAEDYRGALEALPTNVQTLLVHAAQSLLFNRMLTARLERGLPFARPVAGDVVCFADDDGVPDVDRLQRVTDGRVETVARHCERGRAFVTAPLVGTDTELGDGVPGEIERAVLDDAGIAPGDFDLPGEFGSTGTRRAVLVRTDLEIEAGDRDGEGTADEALTFAFDLPKGSYATVVLREYLKLPPAAMA